MGLETLCCPPLFIDLKEGDKSMKKLVVMGLTVLPALFATLAIGAETINGAGATFPNPIYQQWFSEYKTAHPEGADQLSAAGVGRGNPATYGRYGRFRRFRHANDGRSDLGQTEGKDATIFRPCLGADCNDLQSSRASLDSALKLTPEAIAGIYLGTVKKWNDAEDRLDESGA